MPKSEKSFDVYVSAKKKINKWFFHQSKNIMGAFTVQDIAEIFDFFGLVVPHLQPDSFATKQLAENPKFETFFKTIVEVSKNGR